MRRTGSRSLPKDQRQSRYDVLLKDVDGEVVLLERGEDFDGHLRQTSVVDHLTRWANSRGLKAEISQCIADPETGRPSEFVDPRTGRPLPFGIWIRLSSRSGGKGGRRSQGGSSAASD
jgi:hypothetical protein